MTILLTYGTARVLLAGDAEVRDEEYRRAVHTQGLKRSSRFETTKPSELRFRAVLIEGSDDVLFHQGSFDRFGKTLA